MRRAPMWTWFLVLGLGGCDTAMPVGAVVPDRTPQAKVSAPSSAKVSFEETVPVRRETTEPTSMRESNPLDLAIPGPTNCPDGSHSHVIEGPFVITSDADVAILSNISEITGDLIVNVELVTHIDLGCLERVGGAIIVQAEPPCVPVGVTETLTLPQLRSVGGLTVQFNKVLRSIRMPSLRTVRGDVTVLQNAELAVFEAPAIARVNGAFVFQGTPALTTFSFPELRWVAGDIQLRSNDHVTAVDLPELVSAGGLVVSYADALTRIDVRSLEEVSGEIEVKYNDLMSHLSFPKLEEAGGLAIRYSDALVSFSAPKLAYVTAGCLKLHDNDALTSFWLPVLEEVAGCVSIGGNGALASFSLPLLKSVGLGVTEAPYWGGFAVSANDSLTKTGVPLLERVGGSVLVSSNLSMKTFALVALKEVDHDIEIKKNEAMTAFSFPALHTARDIEVKKNPVLDNFAFSKLVEISGGLVLAGNPSLQSPGLSKLRRARGVTFDGNASATTFELKALEEVRDFGVHVTNNPKLTSLKLNALAIVEGKFEGIQLVGNDALTWFVFPSLKEVPRFVFEDNAKLGSFCIPQLKAIGYEDKWTPPTVIRNNPKLLDFVFPSVKTMGAFIVEKNAVLSSFGMYQLDGTWDGVSREIVIRDNPNLKKLPLHALASVGGDVYVTNNEALAECLVSAQLDAADVTGEVMVEANDSGCVCTWSDDVVSASCE